MVGYDKFNILKRFTLTCGHYLQLLKERAHDAI
jgi:hypothetical protein